MVWSDQSQFPFYVIDNNGNIILTIDQTGLHLIGSTGRIDAIVTGVGQPTFYFSDPGNTNPSDSTSAFINSPNNRSVGIDSANYSYTMPSGPAQIRHGRTWIRQGLVESEIVDSNQNPVGGTKYLDDTSAQLALYNANNVRLGRVFLNATGNATATTMNLWLACGNGSNDSIVFTPEGGADYLIYSGPRNRMEVSGTHAGWHLLGGTGEPAFQNGWGALGGTYAWPAFRRNAIGNIELSGCLIGGTKTDGTVLFTLPAWAKPVVDKIIPTVNISNGTWPGSPAQLRIRSATGNVEIWAVSTTTNGAHSWDGSFFDQG